MVNCDNRESGGEYREGYWRSLCHPCFPRPRPCCCCGPQGPKGDMGPAGPAGKEGKSAYQIAVDNGFPGSETEWLDSLKGPSGPFLSSYMEALGTGQTVAGSTSVVFDTNSIDGVGNNIVLDASGTVFTINRTGLYHIEWDVNLAPGTASAVIGIIENGAAASGASSSAAGNFSSGTLIQVDNVPFTLTLYNYDHEIILENPVQWEDSAAAIRILRFADGPSL